MDGESGGGSGNTGGDVQTVTIAEFNAAAESTNTWYQLTGTISNIKEGDHAVHDAGIFIGDPEVAILAPASTPAVLDQPGAV